MKNVDLDHIIMFHSKIIRATGGIDGIKDMRLLESALNRGQASFDGQDLHPNITEKISVITHSLISNHGFIDGNKRIGISVMLLLLQYNDIPIQYTQEELVYLALGIATGSIDNRGIERWIESHKNKI